MTARGARDGRTGEGVKVQIRWRLRHVMASREVWTAKALRELLAERGRLDLSKQAVSDLLNKQPVLVKVKTLEALCTALECTPNELFGLDVPREAPLGGAGDTELSPRQK